MTRSTALRRVGALVLGVNLALVLAKGAVWHLTGSLAVGSEAVNSLADAVYSVVILGGIYLTTRPPDVEHPHGHERIEPFVGLFVAAGILAAGGIVLWQAATALQSGTVTATDSPAAVGILAAAAGVKVLLYRYCLAAGRRHNSPALVATAVDNRNDILTAVAALAGVVGAAAGFPLLDPAAAALVGIGVLYTGVEVIRDNVGYLVGAAPPDDLRGKIVMRALAHPEVKGVHDVIAHYVGPEIDVSMHIEVEGNRTLLEAHGIETEIVDAVAELPEVDDVFVHVDPKELDEWKDDSDAGRVAGRREREESGRRMSDPGSPGSPEEDR